MNNNTYSLPSDGLGFRNSVGPLACALCAAVLAAGCDLPDRPELQPVKTSIALPTENPVADDDTVKWELPTELEKPTWETWDAYFINNEHVGYSHVQSSPARSDMEGDIHFEMDHRVYQHSGAATVLQRLTLTSDETKDGRLVGFEGSMQVGLSVSRFSGTRERAEPSG